MKILVTGFDPFGGSEINPAIEVVKRLPDELNGATIIKLKIPTVFHKGVDVIIEEMNKVEPDYVISLGQAGGRYGITPERVAINLDDARIPDNEGNQPIDTPIQPDGDTAYFSQLPIKAMVQAMKKAGIPASISNTAGTFVCNHVMYQILYLTHTEFIKTKAGFIHIPFLPEQAVNRPETASMSLDDMVKGITVAMETIITFHGKDDLKEIGGAIS